MGKSTILALSACLKPVSFRGGYMNLHGEFVRLPDRLGQIHLQPVMLRPVIGQKIPPGGQLVNLRKASAGILPRNVAECPRFRKLNWGPPHITICELAAEHTRMLQVTLQPS